MIVEVYDLEGLLRSQRMFSARWAACLWVREAIKRFNGTTQDQGKEIELGSGVTLRLWGGAAFEELLATKLTREQDEYSMPDDQYASLEQACLPPAEHPFKSRSARSAQLEDMPASERPLGGGVKGRTKREAIPEGSVTIKDLCAELKVDARAARGALRKKFSNRPEDKRWVWTPDEVSELDAVRTLLRSL